MKAVSAKRLGQPYRHPSAPGMYQEFVVTMADGSERRTSVPVAYGPASVRLAKLNAEQGI
jgi:hypothetical protein